LNPSNTDLYFESDDEVEEAMNVVKRDSVYYELRDAEDQEPGEDARPFLGLVQTVSLGQPVDR
jgi:hypothetical protein